MDNFFKSICFLLVIFLSFLSCKNDAVSEKKHHTKPSPAIPELLKNDAITSEHLIKLSANLDSFSVIIESIADGIDEIGIKDIKKPSVIEKVQLMSLMLPYIPPAMALIKDLQKLDTISERIKDTLPEEKRNAFLAFENTYKLRFDSLNMRFKQYLSNDSTTVK
ncbi:MAG: hypothetical protein BWY70_01164 [Bacteroidetes bacterium ADurb.Bin408]|nr:MAG: hypothetical protein BWY70_01164 [Bacteroidetes bacterium ADurb.Bin408]